MENIQSKDEFQALIEQNQLTIIKFVADWCPDCKRMDFFIDEIIEENEDKNWYEINKDAFPELAEKYEVMGIPTLCVFKNGEKLAHLHSANAKTPEQVRAFLKTV